MQSPEAVTYGACSRSQQEGPGAGVQRGQLWEGGRGLGKQMGSEKERQEVVRKLFRGPVHG